VGGLVVCDSVSFLDDVNLLLDQRCQDPTWTNDVACDSRSCGFQSDSLCESNESVLGSNVGGLVHRGNQTVNTRDVDDSSPFSLFHLRNDGLGCVEVGTEVQSNDFLPHFIGEFFDFANVLDSSIVDQDIDSTELFSGLVDEVLGIRWFGKVSIDEFSLDVIAGNL